MDILKKFLQQADELYKYKKLFDGFELEFNFDEYGANPILHYISEEELSYAINLFRPFYEKSSKLYFKKICQHILANTKYTQFHKSTENALALWAFLRERDTKKLHVTPIKINTNDQIPDKVFEIWLNEGYVHQENFKAESEKGLDQFSKFRSAKTMQKTIFIRHLQNLSRIVVSFNIQVVEKILKENNE